MQAFCASKGCENLKLVIASAFVFLLIVVAFIGISLSYCVLQVFPLVNFIILFICLTLLAYVEALHYACVAVEKWDMAQYAEKFPRAVRCHSFVDTPEKVKQFLVGRQFFVIFVVFLIAQITSFPGKLAATHYDDDDEQAQQCVCTDLLARTLWNHPHRCRVQASRRISSACLRGWYSSWSRPGCRVWHWCSLSANW